MIDAASPAARLSVAPMMDWTDRHCRYLHRLLAPDALLYTEMVHSAAVVRGDTDRFLDPGEVEGPVALQLGGCDPAEMAAAARLGEQYGYDVININVGCPSDRVQSGRFGACLMAQPQVVADCVRAMTECVSIPVTIKTRIGIDDRDSDEFLAAFVDATAAAGCRDFVVHARIAVLSGLSPKQNREIPPLNYPRVYRLKRERPQLRIVVNGGIRDVGAARAHLARVDGVMIGREAYHNPMFLAALDRALHPDRPLPERDAVLRDYAAYAERQLATGIPLRAVARHTLGLFQGQPGARRFRRILGEGMQDRDAGVALCARAAEATRGFASIDRGRDA